MKKVYVLLSVCIFVLNACQKNSIESGAENVIAEIQQPLRCGMEEAMANVSPEFKNAMARNAQNNASGRAAELLIFLDFDGAVVRPGFGSAQGGNVTSPLVNNVRFCAPSSLRQEQKDMVLELVKDDFSPFNILFTTEQSLYDAYPTANKQVCILINRSTELGFPNSVFGVSPTAGLGNRLSNNPCFVFTSVHGNDLVEIALTTSHELAHTMGLLHQSLYNSNCNFLTEYHPGFGTGPLSFTPIMGNGFLKRVNNWFDQSCPINIFNVPQNDFAYLNNQVELKDDDFPNQPMGGAMISSSDITGILEQAGDEDFIKINFRNPGPVTIVSDNIDMKASLYLPNGQLFAEYDDPNDINVTIPSATGLKYLKIEAISNVNMSATFMTGRYKINH